MERIPLALLREVRRLLEVLRVAPAEEGNGAVGAQRPTGAIGLDLGFARVLESVLRTREALLDWKARIPCAFA